MRYLIINRDAMFSAEFKRILNDTGVETVLTAWHAPSMNAIANFSVRYHQQRPTNRRAMW